MKMYLNSMIPLAYFFFFIVLSNNLFEIFSTLKEFLSSLIFFLIILVHSSKFHSEKIHKQH